jgi:hypothetical protein
MAAEDHSTLAEGGHVNRPALNARDAAVQQQPHALARLQAMRFPTGEDEDRPVRAL